MPRQCKNGPTLPDWPILIDGLVGLRNPHLSFCLNGCGHRCNLVDLKVLLG
jgi:hypothetical protein